MKRIALIRTFVRHPNAANLLMALILLVGGVYALPNINRQIMPTIGLEAVSVSMIWPGASAEDIVSNILEVVEPEVRFIDGVKEVNGYASEGVGGFYLVFTEGTNMSRAFSDVENGIARVEDRLPADMEKLRISQMELREGVSRIALYGPFPESALKAYAKEIRDDLLSLGIDQVALSGVRDSEIAVMPAPGILRQLDMKLGDVAAILRESSLDQPSGTIEGAYERQIRSLGLAKTVESVGNIEVLARENGEKLRIKDIAQVEETFDDAQPEGYFGGNRAVSLQIMRSTKNDSIDVAQKVEAYLAEKSQELPASLKLVHYDVRAKYVKDRIELLARNGLSGLVLVVGVLFLFLNGRLAFWVAAGIPVALFAAFLVMLWGGQSFNMMSLMALIMTLGIIVDDAIVVGEHAATRRETGMTAMDAAESGATRMFGPVMASSLTTIAAFVPIFMISDFMGQMARVVPFVVIAVIVASLVECFLILPGHLREALATHTRKAGGWRSRLEAWLANGPETAIRRILSFCFHFRGRFNAAFNTFRDTKFRRFVSLSYRFRYITVAASIGLLIIGLGLVAGGRIAFNFFPLIEPETLTANVVMSPGAPREQTEAMLRELDRALTVAEDKLTDGKGGLVLARYGTIGRSMATESWQELGSDNLAGIWVELVEGDHRDIRNAEIIAAWRAEVHPMAGVERLAITQPTPGPPGRQVDIRLQGSDAQTLKQAALEVRDLLERYPGVRDVEDDLPYGKRDMIMELTPRGRALGFTTQSVSSQVRHAAEGAIAKRFPRDDEEVELVVKYPEGSFDMQAFREMYLRSPQGIEVPLTEIVNLREAQGFSRLERYDGKNETAVTADLDDKKMNLGRLMAALPDDGLNAIADKYHIGWIFRGKTEESNRAMGEIGVGFIVALAAIYIILAWVLGSYLRPIVVMLIIPFGLVGAIMGHMLLGYDLSIMSMIGLLGLSGILVNDSIILVTTIDERHRHGEPWRRAVIDGTRDRLRAVVLTSLTTIGGLLPLLFETSLQAQFIIPIAITMVFGISLATLIVLIVVPALLGILDDATRAVRRLRENRADIAGLPAPEGRR